MRLQLLAALFFLSMVLSCSQEPQPPPPSQSSRLPVVVAVRVDADGRCFVENTELSCKDVGKTIVAAHPNAEITVAIETEKAEGDLSALIAPVEQSLTAVGIKNMTVAAKRSAS